MKILGVGIATLDIINTVEYFPDENSEVRALSQRVCRGGNVTNTLTVLTQFHNQCHWVGVLCNDYDAKVIVDDLQKNDIDYASCDQLKAGKTPVSYILVSSETGSRSIVHHRDMPELSFSHFKQLALGDFDWIHFEGRAISETKQMLNWCKSQFPHIPISVEIEKHRDNIDTLFNLADIYFYSQAYANLHGFDDPQKFLEHQQYESPNAALICAWGEDGAYALIGDDHFHSSPYRTKPIIDTLGAGDTFNAAVIQARLDEFSWQASLEFASKLAGIKCGRVGFDNLLAE